MKEREKVNWRFGCATVLVVVAGLTCAVWRNSIESTRARAARYGGGSTEPDRIYVVVALVVVALAVAGIAWWWRDTLRRMDEPEPATNIERLSRLRSSGALTESEFLAAKSRLLDGSGESRPAVQQPQDQTP